MAITSFTFSISQISLLITLTHILLFSSFVHTKTLTHPFKSIYAFGDSYTDTGNTRSETGPSGFMFVSNLPYGRTFFHHSTNRYSDGRLVIDFVAQALSLPFLPPYLDQKADKSTGVNFAVAGSTAIIHSFFARNNLTLNITPQSLQTQLNWFSKFLESKGCNNNNSNTCEGVFNDALIWVGEIGINDYAYTIGSSVPHKTIQQLAINSVTGFLQAMLKKGAKYVVVQGLPPTGCLTLSMYIASPDDRDDMGCASSINKLLSTHNTLLKAKLNLLRKKFPKSTIIYADYYSAYATIMKNSKRYGFKELYKTCCGYGGGPYNFDYFNACGSPNAKACSNPNEYVNWDGVHLTEAIYKVMAGMFLNEGYCQPSFRSLLSKKMGSG